MNQDDTLSSLSRRRFLRLSGAALGAAMLGGCGTPSTGGGSGAPSTSGGGSGAGPVKLGLLLPYSKVYAVLGESITNGFQLYLDEVGSKAGGRELQIVAKEDEENDPQVSITKARKLIESDQVDFMAGIVATPVAYALRDVVDASKTILIVANAGGNDLTRARKSPYIFRSSFTNSQVTFPLGKWVAENLGKEVFLSAADYAAGHEMAEAFRASFTAAGGTVVGEIYPKLGNTDYGPFLTEIGQKKPKLLFNFYSGADAVNFINQFGQYGLGKDTRLLGAGFFVEEDVLPRVGQVPLGAISSMHWALTLDTPENKKFTADYKAKFGSDANVFAMQGYDTARVIVEALNATNGNTSDKEQLIKAIAAVSFKSPRGTFRFDPESHQVVQDIYIREVREVDGALHNVVIDRIPEVADPNV